MELKLTPFDKAEIKKEYVLTDFKEEDQLLCFLSEKNFDNLSRSKKYRFGIRIKNEFYWFFNGNYTADSRDLAKEAYKALVGYVSKNEIVGKVFIQKK